MGSACRGAHRLEADQHFALLHEALAEVVQARLGQETSNRELRTLSQDMTLMLLFVAVLQSF